MTDDEQLRFGSGYDHNWVLNSADGELSARGQGHANRRTGRVMEVLTTEPGVQFYTATSSTAASPAKAARPTAARCAFCLETQHFPDSPNKPEFPTTVLRPGEVYETTTVYRFSAK